MTNSFGLVPAHPGEYLRLDVMPELGMSEAAFAAQLGISTEALSLVLNGQAPVDAELSDRLSDVLGSGSGLWLALQAQWDGWKAERYTLAELLARCDPDAPLPPKDELWLEAPPVGRELI